ncbi:MAG TPA: hypothetical protein VFO16_07885 [Pseudonocardiaceae bacterium]|nr:hypothetical protein [Pseudonocardiaceae bacterium]
MGPRRLRAAIAAMGDYSERRVRAAASASASKLPAAVAGEFR